MQCQGLSPLQCHWEGLRPRKAGIPADQSLSQSATWTLSQIDCPGNIVRISSLPSSVPSQSFWNISAACVSLSPSFPTSPIHGLPVESSSSFSHVRTSQSEPSTQPPWSKLANDSRHPRRGRNVHVQAGRGTQKMQPTTQLDPPPGTTSPLAKTPATGGEVLVTATGLAKTFDGIQNLFQDLDLTVSRGQKIGLLGANGSGKSTLLKVLAGVESPDSGSVQQRKNTRIGYLAQDPVLDLDLTILDAVLSADTPIMAAVREYEHALAAQASLGPGHRDRQIDACVQKAMDQMEAMDAWDVASEAEKLLEILGVGFRDRQVKSLSGGQRKRVAMAATLLAKPELVILDEPTNHMDVRVIQWMERMLTDPTLTVLLVTHDRYFLDNVCNEMVELEGGQAYRHSGNYSAFLGNRAQRLANQEAAIARAENTLRKETEWMRRQPKARSTKSRSRIDRFYALTKKAERGPSARALELQVGESRLGTKVLAMEDATVARGDRFIFDGFTYEFSRGERVGVVGQNGVGKSTFLDAIAGLLPLEHGTRDVGETLVLGYYTQQTPPIPDDMRAIDYARQFGEVVQLGSEASGGFQGAGSSPPESISATSLLERFGFSRAKQYTWAGKLSGGEKRRLYLATILMRRPNFLLLDEPTNDLDLPTIEVLEKFLDSFEGCLLVASHDRAFMDNVTSRLFVLEGDGEVQLFDGTYSEYMEDSRQREKEAQTELRQQGKATVPASGSGSGSGSSAAAATANGKAAKGGATGGGGAMVGAKKGSARKLSYMEKKEYEGLEKEIDALSRKKDEVEAVMVREGAAGDYAQLAAWAEKLAVLTTAVDAKTERWLELAEIAGD